MLKKIYRCEYFVLQFYNIKLEKFLSRSFDTFDDLVSYIIDYSVDLTLCKCFARYNNFTFYFDLHLLKNLEE